MTNDEAEAILLQLEPTARAGCHPWTDTEGSVWPTGMKLAVQVSIAISLKRLADRLAK